MIFPLLFLLFFTGYAQNQVDAVSKECLDLITHYGTVLTAIKDSNNAPSKVNSLKYEFLKLFNSASIYNYDDITNNSSKPFISTKRYVQNFDKNTSQGTIVKLETSKAFITRPSLNKERNAYHIKVTIKKTVNTSSNFLDFYIRMDKEEGKATTYYIDAISKKGMAPKYPRLSALQNWWVNLDSDWQQIIRKELKLGETPTDYYLKRVIGIRKLNLEESTISDFKPLLALKGLLYLNLKKTRIKDLNYLSKCSRLKELDLSETGITDLKGLNGLVYMAKLLINKNELTDLTPLANMKNLVELDFSNNQVEDLTPLAKCTKMRDLRFNLNIVKDLSPIQNLAYLEKLHFRKNQDIESLAPLSKMSRLVELNCFNSNVTTLETIKHLNKITYLDIGHTKITSLTVFAHLKFLSYLSFTGCIIDDFGVLYKFPYLKYLDCSTTKISDISPINQMDGLIEFRANNTDFSKDDIAKFKKKHPNCKKIYYWK